MKCEWGIDSTGEVNLLRARVRLDRGQWVGLKPAGLVNETSLNLPVNLAGNGSQPTICGRWLLRRSGFHSRRCVFSIGMKIS